mmetsp:Transcript_89785/g.187626  ORF Transcript_89785/g.187626 Transcript_89785/m.187626 type:complete len:219 (-) Transcript_89785:2338-2994(-)
MLAEVRSDGGEDDHLPLEVPHDQSLVQLPLAGLADVPVLVEGRAELEPTSSQGLTIVHRHVVVLALKDQSVELVGQPLVQEVGVLGLVIERLLTREEGLHSFSEDGHLQQRVGCHGFLEVSILHGVAAIRASDADGVGAVLLHDVLQREEIALGLGHLLVVDEGEAVAEEASGPHFLLVRPDAGVVVEAEGKMVLDQVLSGGTEVHGVPVSELLAHLL